MQVGDSLQAALAALLFSILYMFAVWITAVRIGKYSIVDVAWSYGFLPLTIFYAVVGEGSLYRRLLMAILVCLWGARLGTHILKRLLSHRHEEDARYQKLREQWRERAELYFFFFFIIQGLVMFLFSFPFLYTCENGASIFSASELAGVSLWLVGFFGEVLSDRQLFLFKQNVGNRKKVCQVGLWAYSRHPNYFFEWVIWCGYGLLALSSPLGLWSLFFPLLMLHFLLNVSGVPLAEEQSLASRGQLYREYQSRTSVFVPWFKKEG